MRMELWASFLFSTIGAGYFVYGKKQSESSFLIAGGLLCIYPYFVPGIGLMVAIGLALLAAPFAIQRLGD